MPLLSPERILAVLRQSSLFSLLPADSEGLRLLCESLEPVSFPAGQIIFREGDPGDSLYLLVEGRLRIIKDNTLVLRLSERGVCVGEMALITDEPRSATIQTETPTILLRIPQQLFYTALNKDFSIARGVFSALNRKLRENLLDRMMTERREIARKESLRIAAEVQQSLLPRQELTASCLSTSAYYQPADIIGGDYYDYFELPDGNYAIFVADVMDHGIHSAMLMAMLKSGLHTQIRYDPSIPSVMQAIANIADEQVGVFIYLTCCYVILRPESEEIEYANAGNPSILMYSARTGKTLELGSMFAPPGLFGIQQEREFHSRTLPWYPGDLLLLYSDGLLDAKDRNGRMYGLDPIKRCLTASAQLSPAAIQQAVLKDFHNFLGDSHPHDDLTLVVVKAEGGNKGCPDPEP